MPTEKQRVRGDRSINNIKNKHNIEVAASDTFKVSDETTEELHTNKRGIVGTTMESALYRMPPFQNPTEASGDIVETVNSETLSPPISIPTTATKQARRELSNASSLTLSRPLLAENKRFQ